MSLILNNQKADTTQMSIDGRWDKQNVVYSHDGILLSLSKKGNSF